MGRYNKMFNYIATNYTDIKKGGLGVLYRKTKKLFILLLGVLVVIPLIFLVLIIRIIKPIIHIRFGKFWSTRIGHYAAEIGILFNERISREGKYMDLYYKV